MLQFILLIINQHKAIKKVESANNNNNNNNNNRGNVKSLISSSNHTGRKVTSHFLATVKMGRLAS